MRPLKRKLRTQIRKTRKTEVLRATDPRKRAERNFQKYWGKGKGGLAPGRGGVKNNY